MKLRQEAKDVGLSVAEYLLKCWRASKKGG